MFITTKENTSKKLLFEVAKSKWMKACEKCLKVGQIFHFVGVQWQLVSAGYYVRKPFEQLSAKAVSSSCFWRKIKWQMILNLAFYSFSCLGLLSPFFTQKNMFLSGLANFHIFSSYSKLWLLVEFTTIIHWANGIFQVID